MTKAPGLRVLSDEDCPPGLIIWKDESGRIIDYQGTPELLKEYLKRKAIKEFERMMPAMGVI